MSSLNFSIVCSIFLMTSCGSAYSMSYLGSTDGIRENNQFTALSPQFNNDPTVKKEWQNCSNRICLGPESPKEQVYIFNKITLNANESILCERSGGDQTTPRFMYRGSGTAISLTANGSTVSSCGIKLGNGTTTGIDISSYESFNLVNDVFLTGGKPGSTFINIHDGSHTRVINSSVYSKSPGTTAIHLSNTNDNYLSGNLVYGAQLNRSKGDSDLSSVTLHLDTGSTGTVVDGLLGGDSGKHGLLVSNAANPAGKPPREIDITHFYSDCSRGGSGAFFDTNLTSRPMASVISQSWFSGSGLNCKSGEIVRSNSHGIEINGGSQIIMYGLRVRANTGAGYYSTTSGSGNIIALSYFGSNCALDSTCSFSGIEFNEQSTGFLAAGNFITNQDATSPGFQQYGISVKSTGGYGSVTDNICGQLTKGCIQSNDHGKIAYWNNLSPPGTLDPPNRVFGDVKVASDSSKIVGAHIVPNFGRSAGFLFGHTANLYFNNASGFFQTESDGANNGGAGWLFSNNINSSNGLYLIPSSGNFERKFTIDDLKKFQIVNFEDGAWNFTQSINIRNKSDEPQYVKFLASSERIQGQGLKFFDAYGKEMWRIGSDKDASFTLLDKLNDNYRLLFFRDGSTRVQSSGNTSVTINNTSGAGTGGLQIYSGGEAPIKVASVDAQGNLDISSIVLKSDIRLSVTSVGDLPTCTPLIEGALRGVNDALPPTWNNPVHRGGSAHVKVYCNGTNWVAS